MEEKKSYVYLHTRLDTNQVFYVGIGSSENYKRAFQKQKRSEYWGRIAKKYGFSVTIVLDELTWKEAGSWEKYLIDLYGRNQLNKGPLCNMTDGGDGTIGRIMSDKERKRISVLMTGPRNPSAVRKVAKANMKPVKQMTRNGELVKKWNSASDACKKLFNNTGNGKISDCCKGIRKTHKGFTWEFDIK